MTKLEATQALKDLGFRVKSIGGNGTVYVVSSFALDFIQTVYGGNLAAFAARCVHAFKAV